MAEGIDALNVKLAQLIGNEESQIASTAAPPGVMDGFTATSNPFEAVLGKAVDALSGVSQSEIRANQLIDDYVQGKADLQDVMVQTSKMNIMVQLATTTINLAVSTFKELTQMQV